MALVRRVSRVEETAEKERLELVGLVPQYEWTTTSGEGRTGLKLHFLSYLPEREGEEKVQAAQFSGFLDGLTDPATGTVRSGRNCVPFRVTGAAGQALAGRVLAAIALAENADPAYALAAFDATEAWTVKGGSLFVDLREDAQAEALRGDDRELVALYATSGGISGRMMYAPPFEYEEGFE